MISYILENKRSLRKVENELRALDANEALVEIYNVCLCGSDYKLYNGTYSGPVNYPLILGHEWSGKIIDIKSERKDLSVGMNVTGDCSNWGNDCDYLSSCFYNKNTCPSIQKFGITRNGALCEYAIMPVHNLYGARDDMPLDLLALSELFSVALNAIKKSDLELKMSKLCKRSDQSSNILIVGLGAVGLAIYLLLKYMFSMEHVFIYDSSKERVSFIQSIYPDINILDSLDSDENSNNYVNILKPTPYSIIFEATGSPTVINTAINLINPNGTIVLVGMYPVTEYNIKDIVLKSLILTGSIGGTGSFPEVIDFLYNNQEIGKKFITHYAEFNDELYQLFEDPSMRFIKKNIVLHRD